MAFELDYGFAVLFFWLVESKVFNDGFRCWGCNFAPFYTKFSFEVYLLAHMCSWAH
jgi:hypothetical protein